MQRRRAVKFSEHITVLMTEEMSTALQSLADSQRITRTELMRRMLQECLERWGDQGERAEFPERLATSA